MSVLTGVNERETAEEKLARIQGGQFSANDVRVVVEFEARGINPAEITPRENVLTYDAWRAAGRQVVKGAISVFLMRPVSGKDKKTGKQKTYMKKVPVFHISQTVPKGSDRGTRPEAWKNPKLIREGIYLPEVESSAELPAELPAGDSPIVPEFVRENSQRLKETYSEPPAEPPAESSGNGCNCPAVGLVTNVDCPIHGIPC